MSSFFVYLSKRVNNAEFPILTMRVKVEKIIIYLHDQTNILLCPILILCIT